jgi:hypothetical protein
MSATFWEFLSYFLTQDKMAAPLKYDTAANAGITVSNTAINLYDHYKALGENEQVLTKANNWVIYVESNDIRIFENGNTPTASVGVPVASGKFYNITGAGAKDISMIRSGGSDATVWVIPYCAVSGFAEAVK